MQAVPQQSERLIELEAVRGIASIVVLVHHCLLGFAPALHGLVVMPGQVSLFGAPHFALINGSAAVVVFFVLSGFVLTYRAIETGNARLLGIGALKRWPRLAFPVLIVNVAAAILATFHLYANPAVNDLTGSVWLGWFYRANPYPVPQIIGATYEGTIATFLFAGNYFNSNLWTMYFEFFGSFLAFGLAYLLIAPRVANVVAVALVVFVTGWFFNPYFFCFVVGVGLAFVRHHVPMRLPARWRAWRKLRLALAALSVLILFGYHEHAATGAMRLYEFLRPVAAFNPLAFRVLLHSTGAVIILLVALEYKDHLRTPFMALLGRLSFPIYLLHIPLICSVGCYVYLFVFATAGPVLAVIAAIVVVMVVTVIVALPLGKLDRFWLALLRRLPVPRFGVRAA